MADDRRPEVSPRAARHADIAQLRDEIDALIDAVSHEATAQAGDWRDQIRRPGFLESATNLAAYLALRRHDLRDLQRRLMTLGLSSLGRLESRVAPSLLAVRSALQAMGGGAWSPAVTAQAFFDGERRLHANAIELLGEPGGRCPVSLLVTCPSEAAADARFMRELAHRGVDAVRINCAHDDAESWARMIGHLRAAAAGVGRRMKVFMDLAGPKIRTGAVRAPGHGRKLHIGDKFAIVRTGDLRQIPAQAQGVAVECALAEAISAAQLGDRVFVDDGKLCAEVEAVEPWGLVAQASAVKEGGLRLKREKALNFPDTRLEVEALTEKDRADLAFVATHADAVEYSFVQSPKDVRLLQAALAELRPDDWREIGLVLKIETARAVAELPQIIVQAAGQQPTGAMIARGDLSVEIGFARTAEIQEEILWLAEAAAVPVIWATQVLEDLVKTGTPSRGEMTDAAMAARAECVMLNKGPHLIEAIDQLHVLLRRMEVHQHKKSPMLRPLKSW